MRPILLIATILLLTCERKPADAQTAREPDCSEPFLSPDETSVQFLCKGGKLIDCKGDKGDKGDAGRNGSPGQQGERGEKGEPGSGGTSRSKVTTCKFELSTSPAQLITATLIRYSDGFLDINASLFNTNTAQFSVNSFGFGPNVTNLALDLSPFLIRFGATEVGVTARSTGFTQTFSNCQLP